MHDWLQLNEPLPLSIPTVLANLVIGMVLGLLVGWHFAKFGRTLGNRQAVARILIIILLTTILVISIVKASLALSLGLVGALSIVRFRTPIKEPEELAYLFLAIAAGLGLGADQRVATVVSVVAILVLMMAYSRLSGQKQKQNLYLNVEVPADSAGEDLFPRLTKTVADHVTTANIRRMDLHDKLLQATFFVDCQDDNELFSVIDAMKTSFPTATVSFIDQSQSLEG